MTNLDVLAVIQVAEDISAWGLIGAGFCLGFTAGMWFQILWSAWTGRMIMRQAKKLQREAKYGGHQPADEDAL